MSETATYSTCKRRHTGWSSVPIYSYTLCWCYGKNTERENQALWQEMQERYSNTIQHRTHLEPSARSELGQWLSSWPTADLLHVLVEDKLPSSGDMPITSTQWEGYFIRTPPAQEGHNIVKILCVCTMHLCANDKMKHCYCYAMYIIHDRKSMWQYGLEHPRLLTHQ